MSSHSNIKEIKMKLKNFTDVEVIMAIMQGMNDVVNFVEGESKKNCSIDDGRLRASIESKAERSGSKILGEVFTNVEYGAYVHEGTGIYAKTGGRKTPWIYLGKDGNFVKTNGQKANPFIKNAVLKNTVKIKKIMRNGIKKKIN